MDWTKVKIYTTPDGTDIVCASLIGLNIQGFEVENPKDFEDFLKDDTARWDYVDSSLDALKTNPASVSVYIPKNAQGSELLLLIKEELLRLKSLDKNDSLGSLNTELSSINEADWQNNWKQYFKPLNIGKKLVIKPSWEKLPDTDRLVIELDPETSFGTGQHATTQLCLENLEAYSVGGQRMLDLGCGSGILSIAGFRLGASSVTAVDIDENAVKIARKNILQNGISENEFSLFCGNIIDDDALCAEIGSGYDLICANIVADILSSMSRKFAGFLKEAGILVTSGIITERKEEIVGIISECGFELLDTREKEGWASAVFKKI